METVVDRLTRRLQTSWRDYVLPEAANEDRIVLHQFDDVWVAFERSAYFLYQSCSNSSPMVGRVSGNPFPLVICVVPRDKLNVNPSKARYEDSSFRRRVFSTSVRLADYRAWQRTKLCDYTASASLRWYVEPRDTDLIHMLCPSTSTPR